MRILFINYEIPPIGGGGGRATWQIARRLAQRGHQTTILTSLFRGLAPSERVEGVDIRRIAVRRRHADRCSPGELLSFMLRSLPAAVRLADAEKPEVVCAFFGVPSGPAAWWLRLRRKIPYVLSLRGSDVPRRQLAGYQWLHLFARPALRRVWRSAAKLIAVSRPLRDAALAVQGGLRIEVIPNGVDSDFFRPRMRGTDRRIADPPELLYVGRLQEFKGVQHLLCALPEIEKKLGRPVRLSVVGQGPFLRDLQSLAAEIQAAGSRSEAHFTGWLSHDALLRRYQEASLMVLPSLVEGHPNVLLEAMATGLPCVGTDAEGIREVIAPDCGLLVPPANSEAIAEAVVRILADPDGWARMGCQARRRAEGFSWDDVTRQYEALLDAAAKGQ